MKLFCFSFFSICFSLFLSLVSMFFFASFFWWPVSLCFWSSFDARGHRTKGRDNPHDDVDDAPPDTTTQHNSAQHELPLCDRCHTAWGGSRQDTHGTPVLTTVRRPWVAQPHEHAHATQVTDTS